METAKLIPGMQVIWTTPMFGFKRFGTVRRLLDNELVRVEFGNDGLEIRNLPISQLEIYGGQDYDR